ncbi:MAG: DUF2059 domain-containing protein [Kiritimatiellae bacterium]|nr:DUF2059 domain-containing protein [Kiritimatiellia bacterium]
MKTWSRSLLSLCILSMVITVHAGPLAHRQSVERLLDLFGVETVCQATLDALVREAVEAEPGLAGSENTLRDFLVRKIGWAALKPAVVELYLGELSEQEMGEILKFYESRTGRKFAALSPLISARVMEIVQERLARSGDEWAALVEQELNRAAGAPEAGAE